MNQPTTPNTVEDFLPLPQVMAHMYGEPYFTADQVRAAILADRAQRTVAATDEPKDGLVNPPSRAEPAANACAHCGRLPTDPEYCDWIECPGNSAEVGARFRAEGGITSGKALVYQVLQIGRDVLDGTWLDVSESEYIGCKSAKRILRNFTAPSEIEAAVELPPKPDSFGTMENVDAEGHTIGWIQGYTDDQLTSYAIEAVLKDRANLKEMK